MDPFVQSTFLDNMQEMIQDFNDCWSRGNEEASGIKLVSLKGGAMKSRQEKGNHMALPKRPNPEDKGNVQFWVN